MEKWLFYERQGEVSCTPAASIKSAPSPSGYEKNIFSRASAVKRRCQDRSRVARTPGICVFNGPILGGYIGRAINPPGKWIRYAHVDRLGWSMQRTGHGDLRRMITEDAARFGGTWDAIECESVKWLLDFLEIRLVKRGYKFTDYESRHEISRCFFNEYRLPLIGKIISEATNGRTLIPKKLDPKNPNFSSLLLWEISFTIDVIRSLSKNQFASESIATKRRQCRFPTIDCKAGIDQNGAISHSLPLPPASSIQNSRVHRARGGSFVFHFPSDTRADCSIELH